MTVPTRALLFDLGGVLVDIEFARALSSWQPYSSLSAKELAEAFRFDPAYEQHERGQISSQEYFSHLASALKLSASLADVEAGWNAIFKGEITETRHLVQKASRTLPCYAFTNTNGSHMRTWAALYPQLVSSFQRIFASHEIGMRKPDRRAFEFICESIGCTPGSVLFFDDLPENVEAAQAAGLPSVLVRSPKDVESALKAAGAA
jgi:FMN phosphatase YigB (HAD superfamily)